MTNPLKILMLEDSVTDAEIVQRLLKKDRPHCEFSLAMDKEAYVLALDEFHPDVILADNSLPQFSAAEALEISRHRMENTPFIMVTDTESENFYTDIIKLGADDYVLKDRLMRLPVAIEAALRQQKAEKEKLAAIENLNLNVENYRNMVERISDSFIALDLNWRFTYVNKKAEQLFRRPAGYLTGKHIWTEFPETVDRPFYKAYHKAMETQENSTLNEYSILLESWVEANIYPSLSGISIYFRDITEQKKAQEETRRSNERFEMIAHATNDAVWELDLLTGESWYNDTFLLLFGTDPYGTIINPTVEIWRSKLHPDDRERVFINLCNTCAGTSSVWADEFRFQRPDGSYGIFYDRGFIQRDGSGKAVRITGSMIDITELKQVQKQLKESEEKYRNLVEEASDAIFINDKQGNLLDANKSAGNMLGYTKEQFCTMNVNDLYTSEELAVRPIMLKELLSGERTSLERNMKHKNGSLIPVDITAKMLADGRIIAIVRDNSERKKAEEEIRRSNDRFQSLSKATNDAVWDWDLITDSVWWSESFYNFLGFDPKLPVPDLYEWTKKIHPDDRDQVLTKLKGIRKNNASSWEDEFRFQLADASYGTALGRAYFVRDDTGKPVRLIGALMDITQRKKAEEEIKKSNERFLLISKATNDAVWDWNLQTNEIWWNEAHYKQFGFDPNKPMPGQEEFLQKIHPADREIQDRKFEEIQKKIIKGWNGEVRFLQADGSYGTIFQRCFALYDEYDKPVRLVGASIDITEQKRLIREMEVLSIIAKETSNGVMIFDKKNEHILWINEGFTRLTGYTQQDMYGKIPGPILYGKETNQHTIEYIKNQKAGNLPYSADILIYTKKGEKKWHYLSGQPIPDENGQITKYFVLSTDISDRLRIEQERLSDNIRQQKEVTRAILHAQEAQRNELGRELHDNINQILSAISMKLDFCIENYPTSKTIAEDCRQHVQDAIKETRNLSHRMVMPRFSEISLKKILRSLVANYNAKQTVELDTDQMKEKDIPAAIKETLFRIVQEQLSNIQKHAKAEKIRIRLANDPGQVALLIEDNGVGFDTHQKRKGIGITNILNRVESYYGAVDIISGPGMGCTLSVKIPLTGLHEHSVANGL